MTFALDFCAIAQKRFFEPLFLLNFEFVTQDICVEFILCLNWTFHRFSFKASPSLLRQHFQKISISSLPFPSSLLKFPCYVISCIVIVLQCYCRQIRPRWRHDRLEGVHRCPPAWLGGPGSTHRHRKDRRRNQPTGGALHLQAKVQGLPSRRGKIQGKSAERISILKTLNTWGKHNLTDWSFTFDTSSSKLLVTLTCLGTLSQIPG